MDVFGCVNFTRKSEDDSPIDLIAKRVPIYFISRLGQRDRTKPKILFIEDRNKGKVVNKNIFFITRLIPFTQIKL